MLATGTLYPTLPYQRLFAAPYFPHAAAHRRPPFTLIHDNSIFSARPRPKHVALRALIAGMASCDSSKGDVDVGADDDSDEGGPSGASSGDAAASRDEAISPSSSRESRVDNRARCDRSENSSAEDDTMDVSSDSTRSSTDASASGPEEMPSSSDGSGSSSGDSAWQGSASDNWVSDLPQDQAFKAPWRVILPCAGFGSPERALQSMRWNCQIVGVWENDEAASTVLRHFHGKRQAYLHVGKQHGDVLKVNLDGLPAADMLVAGPPCPPFSKMGHNDGEPWRDDRARVFLRITEWIVSLSRRGLKCFVLENVVGIVKAFKDRLPVFKRKLHGRWHLEFVKMTSFCTAQSRGRVYFCGYILGKGAAAITITPMVPDLPRKRLRDMLLARTPISAVDALCKTQRVKYRRWLRFLKPQLFDRKLRGTVACFDIDRDPRLQRRIVRTDDTAPCLRTRGKPWVLGLGVGSSSPQLSRPLHAAEMCLLQGLSPCSIPHEDVSAREITKGCGNAMTVPVVGSVMHGLRRAYVAAGSFRAHRGLRK